MKHQDHDGKSKTASAVDAAHYPEQNEFDGEPSSSTNHEEIAARAHELWIQRGCRDGSAEQDWFEASEELRGKINSHNSRLPTESGSVQH